MITLGHRFDPSWDPETVASDAGAWEFAYGYLLGDVTFVLDEVDLSAPWGWVPVVGFALELDQIATSIEDEATFEFTESDAAITFRREGDRIRVTSNYAPGEATVLYDELHRATGAFVAQVIDAAVAAHPQLARNRYLAEQRRLAP